MKREFVAVFDSGIGGLNVLWELEKNFDNVDFGYFGDNKNAPYGSKSERELLSLFLDNYQSFSHLRVDAIVLACNTLSVSIRERIQDYTGVKVFCVFPPVEREIILKNRVALLATPNTIKQYSRLPIDLYPLPYLAQDIEKNVFNLSRVSMNRHLTNKIVRSEYDTVILGCTHYDFVKNKILDHFCPRRIISGKYYTVQMLKMWLKDRCIHKNTSKNQVFFFGRNSELNKQVYFKVVKKGEKK